MVVLQRVTMSGRRRRLSCVAELDVNPADLIRVADAYGQLAARAAQISPQAATEVQRIAETHGPMGYPTAVGVAAGLANREAPLLSKVDDFNTYAQRFTEHAAAYTQEDAAGARRLDAVEFSHTKPKNRETAFAETAFTPAHSGVAVRGGGVVIIWCVPAGAGFRCTNLFPDGTYVVYPSPSDRTGAWLP